MKRFNSKTDSWLIVILVASLVIDLGAIVVVMITVPEILFAITMAIVLLLTAVLIVSILVATYYTVDKTMLKIVCGPFRLRIALDDIRSVKATRNPLSSPALSLDRLMIQYGKNRRVMVSPADKRGFLKAIGQSLEDAS